MLLHLRKLLTEFKGYFEVGLYEVLMHMYYLEQMAVSASPSLEKQTGIPAQKQSYALLWTAKKKKKTYLSHIKKLKNISICLRVHYIQNIFIALTFIWH